MRADREFAREFAVTKDLDFANRSVCQTSLAQSCFVNACTIFKPVQSFQIDRHVTGRMASIVESTFRNSANERHLTAFEADTNRTAGTSGLTFATAAAGFAVTTGFALAKALAPMFGTGARFEIVETHDLKSSLLEQSRE